jgi:hypothetical protein
VNHLTEPGQTREPLPRRSTRRRWAIIGLLLAVGLVLWRMSLAHSLLSRAGEIRLGQPRSEVIELLGEPHMAYNMGAVSGEAYSGRLKIELLARVLLQQFFDLDLVPDVTEMDVDIRYDDQQRVNWIRAGRGSEPLK